MITCNLRGFWLAVMAFIVFSLVGIWAIASGSVWVSTLAIGSGIICCEAILRAKGGIGLPIIFWPTRSLRVARWQVAKLFDSAQWEIRIIIDSLPPSIYEAPIVHQAIENAIARRVHIKVIAVEPELDPKILAPDHWVQHGQTSGVVTFWHRPNKNSPNILMVDGRHTRIDDRQHRAICLYHALGLTAKSNRLFEKILANVGANAA